MSIRYLQNFRSILSTAPSFEVSLTGANSTANALEAAGLRLFDGPTGRAVRFSTKTADDYYLAFGTSDIVASSSESIGMLGGTVETFFPTKPDWGFIALQSSTDVTVNVTLGHGQ